MTNVDLAELKEARLKLYRDFGLPPGSWEKINRLLKGSIDMHMHPGPTFEAEPRLDVYEAAVQAKEAGMRAIVLKNHHYCTAPLAHVIGKLVPDIALIGGVCIDTVSTGGLNIHTIRQAAIIGAKIIWFPTLDAPQLNAFSGRLGGISILDSKGGILPIVTKILEIAKQHNMVVCNGHLSFTESLALFKEAKRLGMSKLVATHVLFGPHPQLYPPLSLDQQKQLAEMGVYLEHSYREANADFERFAMQVRAVGVESCVIGTDTGQVTTPAPVECMRLMITKLLAHDFSEQEVKTMSSTNASKLLDLN
jgi:Family of unknown function (DUF6282)